MKKPILEQIQYIIKNEYPSVKTNISTTTKFKDVQLDSLDLVDIVLKLELYYEIRIADEVLMALKAKAVQDLINEIEKLLQK